jgi:hypothetical protein
MSRNDRYSNDCLRIKARATTAGNGAGVHARYGNGCLRIEARAKLLRQ